MAEQNTPPAVSDALLEAVARDLASVLEDACVSDAIDRNSFKALLAYLLRPAGPLALEIARLTGERDAANEKARETGARVMDLVFENTRTNARAEAAEAEARGRRQGLEEAAKVCKAEAEHWGPRAAEAFDHLAKIIRATAPVETQKPETGEGA